MVGTLTSPCPACGSEIQSTWRWCLACGYDPDGARHARRRDPEPATGRPLAGSTAFYAAVVVVSLLLAGVVYVVRSRSVTPEPNVAAPAGTTTAPAPTWTLFAPPKDGFKVELPGQVTTQPPQPGTMAGQSTTVHAFTSTAGPAVVGVTYADLGASAGSSDADKVLDGLLHEAADSLGGSVQSSTPRDVGGHRAVDYVIDIRGTNKNQGRILLVGTRVYILNVIAPAPRQSDVDHLVGSFSTT